MKLLTILGVTMVLGACASEPLYKVPTNQRVADYVETTELPQTNRIRKGNSDAWQYLNDRYVIYRGRNDYLIEFRDNCRDLADNAWIPADYIHDHRNLRAGEDTIRGCIIENIYSLTGTQRIEIRTLLDEPPAPRQ